jgi:hypothetical protein
MKAAYVAEDAADLGLRHTLNLGHTVAHGIEGASAHAVPHGEAVAIGLIAESRFGEAQGITPEGTAARLESLLLRLGLPVGPPPGLDAAAIAAAMGSDKKRRAGKTVVVVPAPGGAELLEDVDPAACSRFFRRRCERESPGAARPQPEPGHPRADVYGTLTLRCARVREPRCSCRSGQDRAVERRETTDLIQRARDVRRDHIKPCIFAHERRDSRRHRRRWAADDRGASVEPSARGVQIDIVAGACRGVVAGFGWRSYLMALDALAATES